MTGITVNMVVKNEDNWVWYAISSVLPFVDRLLVNDAGSTDQTVEQIKLIDSKKIEFFKTPGGTAQHVTKIRQWQLDQTKTDWIWIVDGDEIYTQKLGQEIVGAVESGKYEGVVVRRYDLLGDVYHFQSESVGEYKLLGHKGHLSTRLTR